MAKRLLTLIAIIVLAFVIYFALPLVLKDLFFGDSGIGQSQFETAKNWSLFISVVMILFGVGKISDYAESAGRGTKMRVDLLMYGGLFLLVLPCFLRYTFYLTNRFFDLNPVYVVDFLLETNIHVAGFVILTVWGIIIAWLNRGKMEDRPVFENVGYHFADLTKLGWVIYIILVLLFAGYIYILVDGFPPDRPEGSAVTIAEPGYLKLDAFRNDPTLYKVERGDTVQTIHRIGISRMLITMADGGHGWYETPFIQSENGWNGYLFRSINRSDIKVSPGRAGASIPGPERETYRDRFLENSGIEILEFFNEEEGLERFGTATPFSMWAKVNLWDRYENREVSGWIPYHRMRIHGQMHDSAIPLIWTPMKWITMKLDTGFLAGVINILIVIILIPTLAFIITKFLSSRIRFLPNFFLILLLIVAAGGLVFGLYFSLYDASVFNWSNFSNETGHVVFIGITGVAIATIMKVQIETIYERRCTWCKYWEGYVYGSELLSRSQQRYKITTRTHYSDGSSSVSGTRYETHINENWKDFCECGRCGYRWTLRRHEYEKKNY